MIDVLISSTLVGAACSFILADDGYSASAKVFGGAFTGVVWGAAYIGISAIVRGVI